MKVLHLIDSGGLYGAEKMLLALVQEQVYQGLSPTILSAGEPGIEEKAIEAEARRLNLSIMPWRMRPGFNLSGAREIFRWAKANGFELLHSHGYKFNVLMGLWPEPIRGLPLITTLHGYVKAPRYTKAWLYELLDRLILPQMQQVFVVSETMKKQLPAGVACSDRLAVVVNGLNVESIVEDSHQPVEGRLIPFLERHNPVILAVGRLSREKGFERLLDAFADIINHHSLAGLLIVGEGRQRRDLEEQAKVLGVEDHVLMPGYVENVAALMANSDVLCMPSHTEGLPITLLEAMSVGVPIVASSVGEIPQVMGQGQGGTVLKDLSAPALAKALCAAIANGKDGNDAVDWSRNRVVESYSVNAMAANYLQAYQRVLP